MTIAVRPASRRRSPASMRPSVCRSTFEVASSRTRIRGSAMSARANATSWRWPAESCTPRSPTSVSRPVRQRRDELPRADRPGRRLDVLGGRVRAAERDVVADRAAEQERLLRARCPSASAASRRAPCAGRGRRRARGRRSGRRSARRAWRTSTCRRRSRRRARRSGPAGPSSSRPRARTSAPRRRRRRSGTRRPRSGSRRGCAAGRSRRARRRGRARSSSSSKILSSAAMPDW